MTLSEHLSRLSVRAKQAEDRTAAAQAEARDRLAEEVGKARRRTQEAGDRLRAAGEMASEHAETRLDDIQRSWDEHVRRVRERVDARKVQHDARVAERDAEAAADYADFAIDFAYNAIEEAEPMSVPVASWAVAALTELGQLDRAVYLAVAGTPTPVLDAPMRRLSRVADRSRLWVGIGAATAAAGGRDGRRAAAAGLVALALDSAVVNIGAKLAARRSRPDRDSAGVPAVRQVPMPHSASFPSGHAAAGFAFANAVGQTLPAVSAPLRLLATVVGYSRVHTGVHYPGDVVVGAVVGATVGDLVGWGLARLGRPRSGVR